MREQKTIALVSSGIVSILLLHKNDPHFSLWRSLFIFMYNEKYRIHCNTALKHKIFSNITKENVID